MERKCTSKKKSSVLSHASGPSWAGHISQIAQRGIPKSMPIVFWSLSSPSTNTITPSPSDCHLHATTITCLTCFSSSISVFPIRSVANVICTAWLMISKLHCGTRFHLTHMRWSFSKWHWLLFASFLTVRALFGVSVNHTDYSSCNGWSYELYFEC